MLIRYTVENFLSFKERVTFSMLPGKGLLKKEHKAEPVKGVSVLKTAVVFGANASGKSNLIKAMAFGKNLLLLGTRADGLIDYPAFRLNKDCKECNTRMEYELQANGKNYAYGFVFNTHGIEEEWLYELTKQKETAVFERNKQDKQFNIDYLLKLNNDGKERQFLQFLTEATPDNQLFLHEVLTRKIKSNITNVDDLFNVIGWFVDTLKFVFPHDKYKQGITIKAANDTDLKRYYAELLRYFDTGIESITLIKVDIDKLNIPKDLLTVINDDLQKSSKRDIHGVLNFNGDIYIISPDANGLKAQKFKTVHAIAGSAKPAFFDLKDESDGTVRIIDYIPLIIDLMRGNKVFVIDEMERSLHPNLFYDIFALFLQHCNSVNSQLIVSTHESSLLTQKLLRKDEIWFVVKDTHGVSALHSLEDYKIRFDKEIRKDYLMGRFKGVPRLGSHYEITSLFESND